MLHCCVKTILLFLLAFATISTHVSTHTNEDAECENHKTVEFDLFGDSQIANSIMHAFPRPHPSYSHFQLNTKHTVAAEFVIVNSSAELKWLSIVQVSGKRGVVCTDSSSVRVVECALKLDRSNTKSMFCASRAALVLTNITLSFPFAHSAAQPLISSQPLTHTVQHNSGRVTVESSLIASVCVGAEPFLSPIHVPAIHLASTVFINVTQPHASCADAKRDGGMTEEQHTLIDSCLMDRVENGYDGGIVWGMSVCKGSFTAWNSSFCRSTRSACQRIEHSGSATTDVNECAFHGLKNVEYGGAINHQSTGSCSIQNSEFDDCEAKTAGGACNIRYSSKVTVGTCVFSNCSVIDWAGTLRFNEINQLNVDQCNVTNSAAHWAGGTVEATEIKNGSSFSNNIITSGKVITPDNNETGGGVWCSHTFGMTFSECMFRSCSSENSVGGAMSFSTREHSYLFTKLSFCFFDGNQASSTGADIYASQEWSTTLVESNIVECRTSTTAPNRLFVAGSDRSHLMNRLLSQAFVSKHNGSDTPLCGITPFPCSTLGFSLTLINRSAHPVSITFAPGTYPEAEAAVDSLVLQVAGHKSSTTILPKATTRSFVSLTSGQLTFDSFTVVHGSPSAQPASHPLFSVSSTAAAWIKNCLITADTAQNNVFGAPLITMDGGALAVENCEINTITLSEAPLIRAAVTAELALTNSTISAVQRGVGSGAGAECDIEDGGAVEMNNVSLSGCACSKGDGGGVWARLRSGGRLQMGAVSAVSFEGCTAPSGQEAKGKGGGVFVSAEDGGCAMLINVVFVLPQTLSQSTTHLLCCKGATLTLTSCGVKTAGGVHSVAFVPLAVTDGKIEATNLVCSAMVLAGQPLISVAGAGAEGDIGKLSVEFVSTTAERGLFEVANGGSLRVWNSTESSPTAPLACPLLSSASAKAILLQNSTFANFDRASRNGGCIECTLADGSSLAVAGCTLSECCSRGANGGGMWVEMKSGSHFFVEGSTDADAGDGDGRVAGFDTCSALKSAEGERGCGGGVYVDAEEGATDFAVGDVVFASCTAEKGSSLFVSGYDLLALINEHSLGAHREEADLAKLAGFERCTTDSSFCIPLVVYLWTNFTADGFVDGAGGGDFSRCGFSEAPCRTVDHIVSTRFAPLPQRPSTITIAPGSTITKALNLLPAAAPATSQPLPSLTMQGAAQASRLSVFDLAPVEQNAFLASSITLTLHSLALCIPAALPQSRAFFCSSSHALCISACSFELREGSMLAYSLILVEEGSFSASQLAIGTDSSATAVSCLPPLVVIHSLGSVSLAGCSVAGVSHSQGNGSWGAAECQGPSARLCIANSTVCGCSAAASDGAGGGLLCSAAGGATVEISNTSFTLCSVPSEGALAKGLGGGVFLDCAGAASGFQLSNTSFDQCSAWKGKNLFVCADSLSQLVTRTTMNFTFAIGVDEAPDLDELSGIDRASASLVLPLVLLLRSFAQPCVVGGEDGVDASLCGYPDYPCQTIPYAASSRFGQSLAALRLQPPFSFRDTLCLCSQPLAIDSAAAGTQIDIRADGEGEGEALVETGIEVGLSGMCFGLPSSFAPRPRAALFWCSAATLTFTACTTAAPSTPLQYSFAVASSGTVLLCQFAMHSTAFAASPAFLLQGSEAAGSFVELHLRSTTTNAPNGLIRAASGSSLRVENSTIADATMDSSEVICSPLTTTLALKNTSFANITRLRGSGGLVAGAVSGGRKFSFANCTMERCSCIESGSTRGGGVVAEVKKGGEWVFEKSTASECTVDGLAGCGGGLFLRFAVADVRYSMKGIAFAANDAWLGKDVYLDALDVSGFLVQSSDDASSCTISVRSAVSSSAASPASAVLATAAKTAFLRILFDLPSAFSSGQSVFLSSSAPHGELFLTNITFSSASARSLSYLLLSAAGQSVHLARCVVQSLAFPDAPLLLMCTSTIAHSSFASISAPASADGGALKAVLAAEHTLATANTSFALCSCSPHSGRGGALFLDCTSSHTPNPFVLGLATSFTQNAAPVGRHVFVASLDLNATVTNSAFAFDCSPFASDPNAFVGSDTAHPATDLFRFLLPYHADAIYLSAAGSDVKRCGSEADPCESFWKGMQQVDSAAAHKTIFIDGHTLVQDPFDLSSFTVQSAPALSEGSPRPALNARSTTDTRAAPLFTNTRQLRLDSIAICTSASFANALQAVILSEGGDLVLTRCAFCSNATSHQPGDYSFVVCRGGTATADNLEMSDVCVVLPVFRLEGSCGCLVAGAAVRSARIASGCVFCFASGSAARTNGEARFVCTNSTFDTVTREDDGPCCVSAEPGSAVAAEMNSTVLESCRAGTSEWGGAWLCWLSGEGHMRMSQCRVVQCACSTRTGRGGGVCLASDLFGSLDFLFAKCAFDANTAWRGRDIFVQCRNIPSQINDTQFRFDLQPDKYNPVNAIFGADSLAPDPIDLMDFITVLQLSTVVVASAQPSPGEDSRQCGTPKLPCRTVGCALAHVYGDLFRMLAVDGQGVVNGEAVLEELSVCALDRLSADILFEGELVQTRDCLIEAVSAVAIECISFILPPSPPITHPALLHIRTGTLTLTRCNVGAPAQTPPPRIHTFLSVESAACTLRQVAVCNLACHAIAAAAGGSLVLHEVCAADVVCQSCAIAADSAEVTIASSRFTQMMADSPNTSSAHAAGAAALCLSRCNSLCVANCTFAGCSSPSPTGMSVRVLDSANAAIDCCLFDGLSHATHRLPPGNTFHEVCSWNGSMLHLQRGSAAVKDTAFANSPAGALSLSNGSATVAKCEFMSNNPSIEGYPSLRRNIICSDSGSLDVMSLKGGDGLKDGSSLWMLNDGCAFDGIVSERDSSFFIPVLESVETKEEANRMKLTFKGMLLVPCNLSFSVVKRKGDEKEIEHYDFDSNGFLSEREAEGSVAKDLISGCGSEIEVSVSILFGNSNAPSLTQPFILKNASEAKGTGNERIVEGGNKEMSIWPLIVIIVCIVCVILLVVIVVLTVRWKKQKRRTEELEVIVEDTVKKDPKAFEMVTMEMSPEDQWRRAEREAEKKNEERIKKRVYEKSLGHSESSEHLLSESGSTEYILGRDSDKIPQWMLEKEEDDEETRKRTPSPSVSSTSTTGTSDTDSTFVRGEDLCPTTSSMSNLVDAMACSSPHEKLIVDLRDSLFMLLHGKNKTKEMAIGTLKEREQTAAQILFWVANLSLHSFDEMDNPLSSLSNLSPHLVLFSEHMVICIVMHSDLLSDDDSDSSSISSSTVVTSTSNDDNDSLPSSAFEDEDSFKKECLRWKAPELLINKKMGATKESVAFSVGMMLWECLTLQIPFGDYEAEIAGEKIKNGERPPMQPIGSSAFSELVKACLSVNPADRQTLTSLKRLLIQHFPPGAAILTLSDAVDYTCCSDRQQQLSGSASCSSISATFIS
eukprot:MONOS_886.1-p1 / transcript=MONOS_886.1 / gene=MONOS_886 / organism=Monocercomonoides_exilis_PA203 / gene_product=unspecified product / transcript_product=unspecified product / location=Mono_scaffold00014:222396-234281(+) / protein_length=3410 / sequence_SO=supercontig / SO=protein_coding / is_pseudo=false